MDECNVIRIVDVWSITTVEREMIASVLYYVCFVTPERGYFELYT